MLKRLCDIALSSAALLVLVPIFIPVILLLWLTGEGEIFFLQERIGCHRKPFKIVKFATMLKNSPNLSGGDITVSYDPRVLPTGQFLRKTKINELPQLWNILVGDMSIIGPRPLTPRIYAPFPDSYKQAIASLRPGLSGIGSVIFRDEEKLLLTATDRDQTYGRIIVPYKAALEEWYSNNQSLWVDLKLIVLTIIVVLRPEIKVAAYFKGLPKYPQALVEAMDQTK